MMAAQAPAPILGQPQALPLLLGLAGPAGCGKSTAATLLSSNGWGRISFANPLRAVVLALRPAWDGWHLQTGKDLTPPDGGLSPREMMRVIGDWVKNYDPRFFRRIALDQVLMYRRRGIHAVIDDVRFPAEADLVRFMGGAVCHVSRPDVAFRHDHNSEIGVEPLPEDLHLHNWGGVQALGGELNYVLAALVGRGAQSARAAADQSAPMMAGAAAAAADRLASNPYPWP
jgi:hypothetical protein